MTDMSSTAEKVEDLADLNDEIAEINAGIAKADHDLKRLRHPPAGGYTPAVQQRLIRRSNDRKRLLQRRMELEDDAYALANEDDFFDVDDGGDAA